MVDAGGSEQFWPHGYKWGLQTAKMLADYEVVWFEEMLPPDDLEGYVELRRRSPLPIATGEVLTRRQSFVPWLERRAVDVIQPDCTKVRRTHRGVAHRLDGLRAQRSVGAARLEHGHRPGGGPASVGGDAGGPLCRVPDAVRVS